VVKNIDDVISGCINRDRTSQEALYRGYYSYAMTVAAAYSQSDFEAEEIVHDGFMKIFKKLAEYDSNYPFTGWFRRIIINSAIDHFRKSKKHSFHTEIDQAVSVQAEDLSAIDMISTDELMSVVRELPTAYRTVFVLYVVEGYKHHEIAEKLGISEGTSKSNFARARQKLREEINKRAL